MTQLVITFVEKAPGRVTVSKTTIKNTKESGVPSTVTELGVCNKFIRYFDNSVKALPEKNGGVK